MSTIKEVAYFNTPLTGGDDCKTTSGLVTITGLQPMLPSNLQNKKLTTVFIGDVAGSAATCAAAFTGLANSTLLVWAITYQDTFGQLQTRQGSYTTDATATATEAGAAFTAWVLGALPATFVPTGTTTVTITAPKNTIVTGVNIGTTAYPAFTNTALTTRLGYGADLIAIGFATASSATANDGLVASNYYEQYNLEFVEPVAGGQPTSQVYQKTILIAESTDGDDLVTAINSALVLT